MNAFVINEEQLKKTGLVIAGVVLAAFISGYYLGSKQLFSANNNTPLEVTDEINKTPMADELKKTEADASLVLPASDKPLKNATKVKKVEKKKEVNKKSQPKKDDKKKVIKKVTDKKTVDKKTVDKKPSVKTVNKKAVNKNTNAIDSVKKTADKNITPMKQTLKSNKEKGEKATELAAGGVKPVAKKDDTSKNDTAGVTGERIYSIQAGMFSSETNANAFIKKLSAKQFDAFISGFESSSGATKYNVRIGKFSQRDQARELLMEFQKSFSSPAYVVISKP